MSKPTIFAVDFDGTCVDHCYPEVGADVPGSVRVLKALVDAGHKLFLWTMRSGDTLLSAVEWFEDRGITLQDANQNPDQLTWTDSPKLYAHVYIDDAALGAPLRENPRMGGRPFVDWDAVERHLKGLGLI